MVKVDKFYLARMDLGVAIEDWQKKLKLKKYKHNKEVIRRFIKSDRKALKKLA